MKNSTTKVVTGVLGAAHKIEKWWASLIKRKRRTKVLLFFITFNRILLYRILRIGGIIWILLLLHLGYWLCLSVHMEFINGLNMYLRIVRNLNLVIKYI